LPAGAGALFGGAVLVRATAGLALVVAVIWEAVFGRRVRKAALLAAVGLAVVGAATVPFALLDWRDLWFGVWKYHQVSWVYFGKRSAVLEAGKRFLPLLLVAGAALVTVVLSGGWRGVREVFWRSPTARLLTVVLGLLTLVHLVAGARAAEYHTLYFPLACMLVAGWLARGWRVARGVGWRTAQVAAVVLAIYVGLFATWPEGTWLGGEYQYPGLPASLARVVKANAPAGERVLCLHPEVLLAAAREGVPGTEMGPFPLLHDYSRGGWRPAGSFSEENLLLLVERKAVPVLALREDDAVLLQQASWWRSRREDYLQRLEAVLDRGYDVALTTEEVEAGKRLWSYRVWVRRKA